MSAHHHHHHHHDAGHDGHHHGPVGGPAVLDIGGDVGALVATMDHGRRRHGAVRAPAQRSRHDGAHRRVGRVTKRGRQ